MGFCGCFCNATLSIHLALVSPNPNPCTTTPFQHWLLPNPSQPLLLLHPILPFCFCFWPGRPRVRSCSRLALLSIFFSELFFKISILITSQLFPSGSYMAPVPPFKKCSDVTNACITFQPILPLTCKLYNLNNSL